jgi:hypothetical protein
LDWLGGYVDTNGERERWIDEMDSIPGIGFKNKMKRKSNHQLGNL